MAMYKLGVGKWVFIDWSGIEPGYGVRCDGTEGDGFCVPRGVDLKVCAPDVQRELVIAMDRPWESGPPCYATFMRDQGMFRCWYEHKNGLGYAESDDGVVWRKPTLGLREVGGSTENNLVNFSYHGQGIFVDPVALPSERYKMVGCHWSEQERYIPGAVSPDGLHWTPLEAPVLRNQHADTQNTCFYDPHLAQYVLYTRQKDGRMQRRGVNRSVSDDFRHFPPSEPVLENDPLDPPDWDIYCNGYSRWPEAPDAHLMRLSMFKHTSDTVDVHLATSRDGRIWHRPQGRTPWIGGVPFSALPWSSIYACAGIVPTGSGEWLTYLGVSHKGHNDHRKDALGGDLPGLAVARVREDGFMSLCSEGRGECWTIPFVLDSDRIRVNVRARYSGFLRCAIEHSAPAEAGAVVLADSRKAAQGFSLEDCDAVTGDHTDGILTWNGSSDLSRLRGRIVRLRFDLYRADLYSIRF
ncbi:MAG: hypothetical protein KAQ78_01105 [Candidatus Latescibacteria bacterium]|nr:hypothetical protein [Candidatus Latescibacterota bacterium]